MLMAAVDTYVAVRRAAGFHLHHAEAALRNFARFATSRGETVVKTQTAIAWATRAASEAQRHNRLRTVIRFAQFLHAEDARHEIPPAAVFCGRRQRPTPYIFTPEELHRLMVHARHLRPVDSLRPHTYSTLFGLLAATGMRPSEARALHLRDVTPEGLIIRESKFKKSRLLPLHETSWHALNRYLDRRRRGAGHAPHLFVSCRGRQLSHTVVAETFHAVVEAAGIPRAPGKPRPRLMDLRHTFAVRELERCPKAREHIGRQMLALTTYLGHAKVASTYWYLDNTPELLADIAHCCEAFVAGGAR
jgi:integrase/recombinase XerD